MLLTDWGPIIMKDWQINLFNKEQERVDKLVEDFTSALKKSRYKITEDDHRLQKKEAIVNRYSKDRDMTHSYSLCYFMFMNKSNKFVKVFIEPSFVEVSMFRYPNEISGYQKDVERKLYVDLDKEGEEYALKKMTEFI